MTEWATKAQVIERLSRWADKLESGELKQVRGYLQLIIDPDVSMDDTGMCCLGVMCEDYRTTHHWGEWKLRAGKHLSFSVSGLNDNDDFAEDDLPEDVEIDGDDISAKWYSYNPPMRVLMHYGITSDFQGWLAGRNDSHHDNFDTIAGYLRQCIADPEKFAEIGALYFSDYEASIPENFDPEQMRTSLRVIHTFDKAFDVTPYYNDYNDYDDEDYNDED